MHNALTGVQVLVLLGCLLIVTLEKGIAIEISYSYTRSLVPFFLRFHIVTTGNVLVLASKSLFNIFVVHLMRH
jgi:hypothetical protein